LTDKTFFDHVSEWFKILLKSGVPALLIGLGWISVILEHESRNLQSLHEGHHERRRLALATYEARAGPREV